MPQNSPDIEDNCEIRCIVNCRYFLFLEIIFARLWPRRKKLKTNYCVQSLGGGGSVTEGVTALILD